MKMSTEVSYRMTQQIFQSWTWRRNETGMKNYKKNRITNKGINKVK